MTKEHVQYTENMTPKSSQSRLLQLQCSCKSSIKLSQMAKLRVHFPSFIRMASFAFSAYNMAMLASPTALYANAAKPYAMSMNPSSPSSSYSVSRCSAISGDPAEEGDQSLSCDCRPLISESFVLVSADVHRRQVHVKWKPLSRCCCRVSVGSSGEVSSMHT